MEQRMNLGQVDPAAYRALGALESYLTQGGLEPSHRHLIRIRASQLNGCAFCHDKHWAEALADGESPRRLFALALWRESPLFTEPERVVLALTDALTRIEGRVPQELWTQAVRVLGEPALALVIMAVATINAWNRVGVATEMAPPLQRP